MTSRFGRAFVAFGLLAGFMTGCETKSITIRGKLLKNGAPMVVSAETYVTLSFMPEGAKEDAVKSYSATFDQKTGTYSVELPPGKYRTMIVVALPAKKEGELSAPSPPVRSDKIHELTKSQDLDIDIAAK